MFSKERSKIIYLTFDDGVEAGTEEVLKVLRRQQVNATFFLTGINTLYSIKRNKRKAFAVLKEITEQHTAANHSFSHANGFYSSYYNKGLLINNEGGRITVLEDFLKNAQFFKNTLAGDPLFYLDHLARLPGRNSALPFTWLDTEVDETTLVEDDATETRTALRANGHILLGWNEEWKMDYNITNRIMKEKQLIIEKGGMDYTDSKLLYPDFTSYGLKYPDEERLTERWFVLANRIMVKAATNHVVLLMHDRAFRPGDGKKAQADLELLIMYLKKNGFTFKTPPIV